MKKVIVLVIMCLVLAAGVYASSFERYESDKYSIDEKSGSPYSNEGQRWTYRDSSDNTLYTNIILSKYSSVLLDDMKARIEDKFEKEKKPWKIDGQVVFFNTEFNYIFWRSGNYYIEISELRDMKKQPQESGKYDEGLIKGFLKIYPSNCDEDKCFEETKEEIDVAYKELLKQEREQAPWEPCGHWEYIQYFGTSYHCGKISKDDYLRITEPEKVKEFIKSILPEYLYIQITPEDFKKYTQQCKENGVFDIRFNKILPPKVEVCYNSFRGYLISNGISSPSDKNIYTYCFDLNLFKTNDPQFLKYAEDELKKELLESERKAEARRVESETWETIAYEPGFYETSASAEEVPLGEEEAGEIKTTAESSENEIPTTEPSIQKEKTAIEDTATKESNKEQSKIIVNISGIQPKKETNFFSSFFSKLLKGIKGLFT